MNFYKDPLIEKLRLIESRPLSEGLSDEEWEQLKQLRAELDKDPDSAKLHADADALIKSKEPAAPLPEPREAEIARANDIPNNPPVDPAKKKPKYLVNPGTRALQHWLNSKGFKVKVDGAHGPETKTATQAYFDKYVKNRKTADPASDAMADEYFDMSGAGVAYNVRPQKTDDGGMMWIGSKRYLAAMNKYGYDPKTGDPIGGGPAKPAGMAASPTNKLTPAEIEKRNADIQSGKDVDASGNTTTPAPASTNPEIAKIDAEIKRFTSGGNNMSLQANKDYVANLEKKKAALAAAPPSIAAQPGIPPELSKAIPSPKEGDEYWVNGTRYVFKGFGGGRTHSTPKWTINHKPGDFAVKADTEWATKNNFTGTPDQANAQYLQKTFPQRQAESTELDRLKQLLKF